MTVSTKLGLQNNHFFKKESDRNLLALKAGFWVLVFFGWFRLENTYSYGPRTGQWITLNGRSMLQMLFLTLAHMFSLKKKHVSPKSAPQNFQNKLWAFTWAGCQTVLRATLEPKPANESLAKNGSKCGISLPFLPIFVICWHALACWEYVKKVTSTLACCGSCKHRSKFVGDMHSHMSKLGRAAKSAK